MSDTPLLCTHHLEGQPLEVKPCRRCGTFVCEHCQGSILPLCGPCGLARARADYESRGRLVRGLVWSLCAGALPILISILFVPLPMLALLGLALVGGLWGGATAGNRLIDSTLFGLPGLATSFGTLFLIEWSVTHAAGSVRLRDLSIPFFVSAVAAIVLWEGANRVIRKFTDVP